MLRSRLPQVLWPALPSPFDAQVIALLHQFDLSQWWPEEALREQQFRQLGALLQHFSQSSDVMQGRLSAFRGRIDRRLTAETYRLVPVLTRADMRSMGARLFNAALPPGEGELRVSSSSGSTGTPVEIRKTELNEIFHEALGLRNHVWHERDVAGSFAAIRRLPPETALLPEGERSGNWVRCMHTGPYHALNSAATTLDEQVAWVRRVRPAYLFSYPSLLAELALAFERNGVSPPPLQGLMSFGEVTTPAQRAAVRRVFGHALRDTYSAAEVSTIALQCPDDEESYHVMAESVLVEIVDGAGMPCPVGVPGRVLVTDLHNLMTPLLRYEIGDVAEWGPPCRCGRGLPVLRRIVGRSLNLLRLPHGDALVPDIERQDFQAIGPIEAVQVVQRGLDRMEVRVVAPRMLSGTEEQDVIAAVRRGLHGRDYTFDLVVLDELPRSAAGKFEAFIGLLDPRSSL